jgi:hypothetical protein
MTGTPESVIDPASATPCGNDSSSSNVTVVSRVSLDDQGGEGRGLNTGQRHGTCQCNTLQQQQQQQHAC